MRAFLKGKREFPPNRQKLKVAIPLKIMAGLCVSRIVCSLKRSPLLCFCTLNFTAPLPNNQNFRKFYSGTRKKHIHMFLWKYNLLKIIFSSICIWFKTASRVQPTGRTVVFSKEDLQIFAFETNVSTCLFLFLFRLIKQKILSTYNANRPSLC